LILLGTKDGPTLARVDACAKELTLECVGATDVKCVGGAVPVSVKGRMVEYTGELLGEKLGFVDGYVDGLSDSEGRSDGPLVVA
jgi:hypothetical protein